MALAAKEDCAAAQETQAEEIVAKLRRVDVLVSQGQTVADAVRSIGVTEVTHYRWRQEFGGLKADRVKRLKELETMKEIAEKIDEIKLVVGADGLQKLFTADANGAVKTN